MERSGQKRHKSLEFFLDEIVWNQGWVLNPVENRRPSPCKFISSRWVDEANSSRRSKERDTERERETRLLYAPIVWLNYRVEVNINVKHASCARRLLGLLYSNYRPKSAEIEKERVRERERDASSARRLFSYLSHRSEVISIHTDLVQKDGAYPHAHGAAQAPVQGQHVVRRPQAAVADQENLETEQPRDVGVVHPDNASHAYETAGTTTSTRAGHVSPQKKGIDLVEKHKQNKTKKSAIVSHFLEKRSTLFKARVGIRIYNGGF